jgi:metallothiol transferase
MAVKIEKWVAAQKKHRLSDKHVQMARELGLNPDKLGKIDNHKQETWKASLSQFIEEIYFKRFKREVPFSVKPLKDIIADDKAKAEKKKNEKDKKRKLAAQSDNSEIKDIYAVWVYVSDLERSKDFYQNKIGLKFKSQNEDWIEFDLGKTSFAILQRISEKGTVVPSKTRIMFEVKDIETFYDDATGKGIKCIGGIRNERYGSLLTFEDPDGHWLEVYQANKLVTTL